MKTLIAATMLVYAPASFAAEPAKKDAKAAPAAEQKMPLT